MPQPSTPTPTDRRMRRQQMLSTLAGTVARTSIDTSVSIEPLGTPAAAVTATPPTGAADQPDAHDPALLVGLAIWTARQHERYVAAATERGDGRTLHSYPTVLVETLRHHADAGDPTCHLVLDWLIAKGLIETSAGRSSREGAV